MGEVMRLEGIKAAFLGDSITEGYGLSNPEKVYYKILAEKTSMETYGYGLGGTRITRDKNEVGERRDFLFRAEFMEKADLIVVFGGTNDYGLNSPLRKDAADEYTFEGACRALFEKLQKIYSGSAIVVMTPLHRSDETFSRENTERSTQPKLEDYVNCLRKIAGDFSLPVVDLYRKANIFPVMEDHRRLYCPDGLHPNEAGHEIIASVLWKELLKL